MSCTHIPSPGELEMVEVERCSGHCCKRFYLPKSPAELKEMHERWVAAGKPVGHDIGEIYDMLIFIEKSRMHTDGKERPYFSHYYTCKHFDGQNCTVYDKRPRICSDYPYGAPCIYKDCTMRLIPKLGPPEPTLRERALAEGTAELDPDGNIYWKTSKKLPVLGERVKPAKLTDDDMKQLEDALKELQAMTAGAALAEAPTASGGQLDATQRRLSGRRRRGPKMVR